ncbi:MAG: RNA methyltransferase [Geminicoccaceae bacterium]
MAEPGAKPRGPSAPVVILVRPQLGENVGTAARAMLNFGLRELRLVRPRCGWPNVKALQAASGATEVLNRLRLFDRVADAASDLHRLYATTARPRDLAKPVVTAAHAARGARAALAGGEQVGFLFGPERTGLSNDDLIYADAILSIPVNPDFFSLNLAQAVLLVAYEWFQSAARGPDRRDIEPTGRPATKGELDQLLEHLIAELDAVDFFRSADRRQSMSRALKLIFARADLRESDVHLLRGVIKDLARGGRLPRA